MEISSNPDVITLKPWGQETLMHQGHGYAVKEITIEANQRTSLHFHNEKHEFIYVVSGAVILEIGDEKGLTTKTITRGGRFAIPPLTWHRMSTLDEATTYVESQTDHLLDVVRVLDDYGRKS